MAKFQFSMQNLLQIKEKLEDQCQMEYGKAVLQRDLQKDRVEKAKARIVTENQNFYKKQANSFIVRDLINVQNKIAFLKEQEKAELTRLYECEDMVVRKRERLTQAMRERKTYESLREKALELYYEEEKQEELKLMDERASFNHSRQ